MKMFLEFTNKDSMANGNEYENNDTLKSFKHDLEKKKEKKHSYYVHWAELFDTTTNDHEECIRLTL